MIERLQWNDDLLMPTCCFIIGVVSMSKRASAQWLGHPVICSFRMGNSWDDNCLRHIKNGQKPGSHTAQYGSVHGTGNWHEISKIATLPTADNLEGNADPCMVIANIQGKRGDKL